MPNDDKPANSLTGRWRLLLILFVLLGLGTRVGLAEKLSDLPSNYIRSTFTIEEGLPDNTVDAITQTENGLLWVGTESGLASFDGRTFTPVRLRIPGTAPPSAINSLVEGPDGDLWVGSDAGIVRIPKKDLNDPNLVASSAYRLGKEQSDEVEVLFRARDGVIWAGTNHGLYRFEGGQFVEASSSIYVSRIKQARNGRLLLITDKGLAEYDGHKTIEHPGFGARFDVHDNQVFDVFEDDGGTVWYGTNKGARTIGESGPGRLGPYQPAHTATLGIAVAPNGMLWVSTGIGLYRVAGNRLESPAPGLNAHAFYAGKDGDLWIGTNGSGLVHLQPRLVHAYTKADGLPNDLAMAVLPARDGRLWVGHNCGLAMLDGSHFKIFREKDGLANSCVWALAEDHKQNIWIGTYGGGVFRYHNEAFTQYSMEQGLASRIVFQITVARDDSLWIATPDGLSHMQGGRIRNYTTADGLSSTRILDIHQDRAGTIWVATQAGVDRLNASGQFVPVPSNASEEVLARRFAEDSQGNLYTTDLPSGISRIKGNRLVLEDRTLNLMNMVESPDHNLWFSSRNGIIRIAEEKLARHDLASAPLDYEQFGTAEGLLSSQASVGSPNIAMTKDGKIWMGTVDGLGMIDTSRLPIAGRMPKVFVAGVSADGVRGQVGDGLVLAPGIHHLELNIAAVDLATPQKIRLQYRMEGVDTNWLDVNSSRTAVYTNIPAGTHPLWVRATDSKGKWGRGSVLYGVTQRPYFYQTEIFRFGAIALLLSLLIIAYLIRIRHIVIQTRTILEERQVERESVARDLHDTFLQGIQGLILRFHTGTQQISPNEPVRQLFDEALRQSDAVMLEGRSVLSRLRTRTTTAKTLAGGFTAIGHDLRSLSASQFDVTVSGRTRDLNTVVHDEIHSVGREALFNAFRHAQASRIEVELHFGVFEFRSRFRDDGIGIDPAILRDGSVPGHYGLPGMRERIKGIGGRMELWSRKGAGTEIEIRIPSTIAYRRRETGHKLRWMKRLRDAGIL